MIRAKLNELKMDSLDELVSHVANSQLANKCIVLKNEYNSFLYLSKAQSDKMGFRYEKEWFLKTDADMPCDFRSASEKLEKAFNNAKAGKSGDTLHVANYTYGLVIEESIISPIVINGKFCGTFSVVDEITANHKHSMFFNALSDRFGSNDCYEVCKPDNLSPTKHLILFLLVVGFSQAEITYIMDKHLGISLSINTVKYHLRDLIEQFKVTTMSQLIEVAVAAKLHESIPTELLANDCFLLP